MITSSIHEADLFDMHGRPDKDIGLMNDIVKSLEQEYFPELYFKNAPGLDFPPSPLAQSDCTGLSRSNFPAWDMPNFYAAEHDLDVYSIRRDFPILSEKIDGKDLIWFDNAATTQKPQCVIDRVKYYYEHENSNVHRAAHTLAARSTDAYEGARETAASFLHAANPEEIVFVRGTTEAINLVAHAYGLPMLCKDDEILVSTLEHHANIVPWQMVCARTGAKIKVIPVDESGQIDLSAYRSLLNANTKIVAFTHVSNALGTITPAQEMVQMAHRVSAKVLIDGAQAVAHVPVDVQSLDCDFYVFSGHKVFGPTGIGVLYAKGEILEDMQPYQGGGSMISDVTFEKTSYKKPPHRFEAGTGNIADAIGLGAALVYVDRIGKERISAYEHALYQYAEEALRSIYGLTFIGYGPNRTSVLPFVCKNIAPDQIGAALNREGIAVRTGHHCAQPILRRFGHESTVRVSLALYNTYNEVDRLTDVLRAVSFPSPVYSY